MEKIQSLAYELHDLLLNSKEFIYLKECEVKMISDVQCKALIDNSFIICYVNVGLRCANN